MLRLEYIKLPFNYLIVLPVSASIIQVQWRLLSYGAGYPGDRIRPDTAPVVCPPHSATRRRDKKVYVCFDAAAFVHSKEHTRTSGAV